MNENTCYLLYVKTEAVNAHDLDFLTHKDLLWRKIYDQHSLLATKVGNHGATSCLVGMEHRFVWLLSGPEIGDRVAHYFGSLLSQAVQEKFPTKTSSHAAVSEDISVDTTDFWNPPPHISLVYIIYSIKKNSAPRD